MSIQAQPDFAREVARALIEQAEQQRRVRQLLLARRLTLQAERTAARARLALARAI